MKVCQNNKKGACAARNYGFELSKGKYIQYLDADDILSRDKISSQVALLERHPHHIAVCSTAHFSETIENSVITDRDFLFSTNEPSNFLLNLYGAKGRFDMIQTSAWLTPRSLIEDAGPWNEKLSKDQDGEFFCRVVMRSKGVVYAHDVLNYYRKYVGGSNVSGGKQREKVESQYHALKSKARELISEKDTQAYKNAMALQYKHIAIEAWPLYKDITQMALKESAALGGSSYNPILGGFVVESIKKIFGWKPAKAFSHYIHNISFQR